MGERLNLTQIKILVFLNKYGPSKGTSIARRLGLPVSTVYNNLKILKLKGLVDYNESTREFSITDKGKHEIKFISILVN